MCHVGGTTNRPLELPGWHGLTRPYRTYRASLTALGRGPSHVKVRPDRATHLAIYTTWSPSSAPMRTGSSDINRSLIWSLTDGTASGGAHVSATTSLWLHVRHPNPPPCGMHACILLPKKQRRAPLASAHPREWVSFPLDLTTLRIDFLFSIRVGGSQRCYAS